MILLLFFCQHKVVTCQLQLFIDETLMLTGISVEIVQLTKLSSRLIHRDGKEDFETSFMLLPFPQ